MAGMSHDELVEAFKKECNNLAIKFRETDENNLAPCPIELDMSPSLPALSARLGEAA